MRPEASASRRGEWRREAALGARTGLPVVFGVIPFALVLGALAAKQGISPLETGLTSAIVFAGSAQFAAVQLWSVPVAVGGLALTAFLINLRHVLMGVALAPHLTGFKPGARALALFWMADEIWALAMRRAIDRPLTPAFYFGMAAMFWSVWVVFSVLGALAGAFIAEPERWGFDFAFVAVFMVLMKSFWRGRTTALIWLASGAAAMAVWHLVDGPWYVVAGAIAGMTVATLAEPAKGAR